MRTLCRFYCKTPCILLLYCCRWEFYTKDSDIDFSVVSTDKEGKTDIVVPNKRLFPVSKEESGFVNCTPNTTCILFFHYFYLFYLFFFQIQ